MRIGLFTSDFPNKPPLKIESNNEWGGVAEVVFQLCLEFDDLGHETHVFTTSPNTEKTISHQNINVHYYSGDIMVSGQPISHDMFIDPIKYNLDVAHAHRGLPSGTVSGQLYSLLTGTPLVTTVHGDINYEEGRFLRNSLFKAFETSRTYLFNQSNYVTTVSKGFLKKSTYLTPIKEHVITINNGVRVNEAKKIGSKEAKIRLNIDPEDPQILFLGAVTKRKNPSVVVKTVDEIIGEWPNIRCSIVGEGDAKDDVESLISNFGLEDVVNTPGFVSEEMKWLYLNAADVLILPSSSESFGLSVIEALSCGTPCIVSDLSCFSDVIFPGKNGYITTGESTEIAQCVRDILDGAIELRPETIRSNTASKYSWRSIAKKYLDVYSKAIGET